jgi:hypothetical protein
MEATELSEEIRRELFVLISSVPVSDKILTKISELLNLYQECLIISCGGQP